MTPANPLTTPGTFVVGCNYWASHAGTEMWRDWRTDVVEQDLKRLASAGIQVMRVFPLWPDFQPLTQLGTGSGPVEYRHGEEALADDEAGLAGVSHLAMLRFYELADLAEKNGLRLIVGLITGWMSGRLFVPPAFQGRNVLTDPLALMWQTRYVKYFVRQLREHPAILAWDLGNECNCMGSATREQAWVWTSLIVDAIRNVDTTRPIVSGMHSLLPGPNAAWKIQDQGEMTDVLTTHPYPYFTPYCDLDPINTIRTELHSTAESRMYGDIGQRPCLIEEIGTLGPMIANEKIAADFIRSALFSGWAHDCHGLLWWCAFDLGHLKQAPYDWDAYERELGLFHKDGTPKPVLTELGNFQKMLRQLPIAQLPPRSTEAVCILSEGQDQWAVGFGSFILAKQAGFDLEFQYADQPLRDSALYLLPCISGGRILYRRRWLELLERVNAGATLYVSHENGMLSPFTEPFGFEILSRSQRLVPSRLTLEAFTGMPELTLRGQFRLQLAPTRATVLGREDDGNPAFTQVTYGKGTIYFLTFPLEKQLATTPGSFHTPSAQPCWQLYEHIAHEAMHTRIVRKDHPMVGVTEHTLNKAQRMVVLINYSPVRITTHLSLTTAWSFTLAWHGAMPSRMSVGWQCEIPANDGVILLASNQKNELKM